jgi:hypothetical protein
MISKPGEVVLVDSVCLFDAPVKLGERIKSRQLQIVRGR